MLKKLHLLTASLLLFAAPGYSQTLLHYWNFNNSATQTDLLTPTSTLITGASITHVAGGISTIQTTSNTLQGFDITNPNARNSDAAGTHLRFNDPIGGALVFALPTTGYKDIVIKYATRRSGSGAGTQYIEYSADGSNYTLLDSIKPVDGNPTLQTLDFTSITSVNNNANFKIRITFSANGGGSVGNNRFDNFTAEGNSNSGTDLIPPVVTFEPANGAVNIAVNVQPVIKFNETIRLVNNTVITNTNVDALVELRLDNASGAAVPFDATISGNDIIITPSASLQNNKTYYVALKANVVEDGSDNAVTAVQSSNFTTITLQTQFTKGDLVFVAYRMNATGTPDEIAFLTLVDILPGTMINFTDAKYTDNTPAQCVGGFTWTSPSNECIPAGTVISIQNDVPSANKGTVTGSGFGLSSSGDQVIVYTGTPASPNFITALTSNGWITNNTSCSGSSSKIPAGLVDGQSAVNLSTAPGNTTGNTVNAYYNGSQSGNKAQLQSLVQNPANWIGVGSGTAAQTWPTWAFPGPPSVVGTKIINQTTIQIIFNRDLETASSTNIANFTGITGLSNITKTNNGTLADSLTLTFSTPFATSSTYNMQVANVKDADGNVMLCPYSFSFSYNTEISFAKNFITVNENAGSVSININLKNPSASSVNLVLKPAPFSTAGSADFTFASTTLNFTGNSNTTQTLTIYLSDDNTVEQDEYFVLSIENVTGATLTGSKFLTVYIKDNDRQPKTATKELELNYVSSFEPVAGTSTCEIVMYDSASKRLFTISSVQKRLDIADFSNPVAITLIKSIDMTTYGGITSIAVKNGIVAASCPNADEQQPGSVVFFNTNGDFQKQVNVGALPDMVTFTPDGSKVLTANEGQPNDAYTVDPEGSISVIDISGGIAGVSQSNVTTIAFTAFNSQEAALLASGVRKLKATSTLAQDFEPEYITISPDGTKAWVTLQENNAIAEINLVNNTITSVWSCGTKDFSVAGNGFDASDNNGNILLANWPIKSFFLADGIANYSVNGTTYLVTANEGDEKEYAGLNERTTVGNAGVLLDPVKFPHAEMLKQDHNMGRLRITKLNGDTDKDGDYDELYMVGARSFSIFNAGTKSLIYDSGDDFEWITSKDTATASIFNADNEGNGFKNRSRAKGPEPEGVTVATISGKTFAFVALERVGGVMVYNITDPTNVTFTDYKNSRSKTAFTGDHGPEGIVYITPQQSPNGKGYIIIANEISGTVSVFEVKSNLPVLPNSIHEAVKSSACKVYPNPNNGVMQVEYNLPENTTGTFDIFDVTGKKVWSTLLNGGQNNLNLQTTELSAGMYLYKLNTAEGSVASGKLVIFK